MSALKNPAVHDDLLNYRLKRLVNLGGAPAVRLCEGGYGITRQEWRLTAALVEGGAMGIGELAERSRVEPARVSRTVKDLVSKRLVERTRDAGDRRQAKLAATDRGRALYRELLPRLARINRRLMEVLDEEEAALLDDFLARLTRQAERVYEEGGGVEEKTGRYLGTSRRTVRYPADAGPA
jgi:DNA-binding MarR family transcriptional regulator